MSSYHLLCFSHELALQLQDEENRRAAAAAGPAQETQQQQEQAAPRQQPAASHTPKKKNNDVSDTFLAYTVYSVQLFISDSVSVRNSMMPCWDTVYIYRVCLIQSNMATTSSPSLFLSSLSCDNLTDMGFQLCVPKSAILYHS